MNSIYIVALLAATSLMMVPFATNYAFSVKYKQGQIPPTTDPNQLKKQLIDKARAEAEAEKKKALEKLPQGKQSKKEVSNKEDVLKAAKAAAWEKAKKKLEEYKNSQKKK